MNRTAMRLSAILLLLACRAVAAADAFGAAVAGMHEGEWRMVGAPYKVPPPDERKSMKSIWSAWNSAAFDPARRQFYLHGGGHVDGGHNAVLRFTVPTLAWEVIYPARPLSDRIEPDSGCRNPIEGPAAGHTYDGLVWVHGTGDPRLDGKMMYWQSNGYVTNRCDWNAPGYRHTWVFDPASAKWDDITGRIKGWEPPRWTGTALLPDGSIAVVDDDRICTFRHDGDFRYEQCGPLPRKTRSAHWFDGLGLMLLSNRQIEWDRADGKPMPRCNLKGVPINSFAGADRWPQTGEIVFWSGSSRLVYLDPQTCAARVVDPGSGPQGRNVHERWKWLPEYGVFVGLPRPDGVWAYRPTVAGGVEPGAATAQDQFDAGSPLACGTRFGGIAVEKSGTVIDGKGCVELKGLEQTRKMGTIWIRAGADDVTIRNIRLSLGDETQFADNRACIRPQGRNLTLDRVRIGEPCGDGILSGRDSGDWKITDSVIERTGGGRNEGHGIYHCSAGCEPGQGSLTIERSSVIDCRWNTRQFGEAIKTRGGRLRLDRVIAGGVQEQARCDRALSFTQAGEGLVTHSVLLQGPAAESDVIIAYGQEARCRDGSIICRNRTDKKFCVADPAAVKEPPWDYCRVEHPGNLVIRDSIVVCDQRKRPCRIANHSSHDVIFERVTFVNTRAKANGEERNAAGGTTRFVNSRVCATRAECGLPEWPEIPKPR
ncbi:MAG: hypothetical protein AB7Q97_24005 [Gammaproteobacteria bacterium]